VIGQKCRMATMMMDGPGAFDEEEGDAVFPCKGCGDVCRNVRYNHALPIADWILDTRGRVCAMRSSKTRNITANMTTAKHLSWPGSDGSMYSNQARAGHPLTLSFLTASIASAVTPAELSSTPTPTSSSLATAPSYATTALTAATHAETRLRI